jgi:heme/copper-type cytochrome/quinol oxidase subunit 2
LFSVSALYAKLFFWVAALCCLVAHLAILRSVLRVSARADQPVSVQRRVVEIAWAIIPALVLAAVLVNTWRGILARS